MDYFKLWKSSDPLYLKSDYEREISPPNLSESEHLLVNQILASNAESVLDLGCGACGILLECQKQGVKEIYGIDASPEAIELVEKRFMEYGTLENTSFIANNIVETELPEVEAVSSHMVFCCFSDALGIVERVLEKKTKPYCCYLSKGYFSNKINVYPF